MSNILTEIIQLLTQGIVSYGQGIGQGINSTVQAMFIETVGEGADATQQLSTSGGLIITFAAVALAIGLTTLLFSWLTSLGKSR